MNDGSGRAQKTNFSNNISDGEVILHPLEKFELPNQRHLDEEDREKSKRPSCFSEAVNHGGRSSLRCLSLPGGDGWR